MACELRRAGWTDENAIFNEIASRCLRQDTREIWEAVRNSASATSSNPVPGSKLNRPLNPGSRHGTLPRAPLDVKAIGEIQKSYGGLDALKATSPADPTVWSTEQLVDALFPNNPLLCLATHAASAKTKHREEWRGKEQDHPLLVPSPMTSPTGINKQCKPSARCLNNTGPRRFQVVEADHGDIDAQAAVLGHLAHRAPLVLVVHSGSRSLHGWFFCEGQDEKLLHRFHSYACSLGADPATWTRCQLIRMPGGVRDTGAKQELLFLNPAACPGFPSLPLERAAL